MAGMRLAETVAPRRGSVPAPGVPDGTILYDGVCVLCSAWFRFVAARDPDVRFRFTPIQGAYGRLLAVRLGIDPDNPQTNAAIIGGTAYLRSDAALQILRSCPAGPGRPSCSSRHPNCATGFTIG